MATLEEIQEELLFDNDHPAMLLGAMAVSALGHGSDLTPGSIPVWMSVTAFICMGALIGTRFRGLDRRLDAYIFEMKAFWVTVL